MQYFMCIEYIQKYPSDDFSFFIILIFHTL